MAKFTAPKPTDRRVTKQDVAEALMAYDCAIGEGKSTATILKLHRAWQTMLGALREGLTIEAAS